MRVVISRLFAAVLLVVVLSGFGLVVANLAQRNTLAVSGPASTAPSAAAPTPVP